MKGWNLDIKSSLSTTMTGMRDKGHLGVYVSMNLIRESYKSSDILFSEINC